MVLYIVGLGLGDEKDITIRGLECVKKCTALYLEYYTSILGIDKDRLEQFYGVPVILADRNMVESEAESIYMRAATENIGFLVVGDPLCATTHVDLMLRAKALGITVEVIHNTSVMGAAASCGLQLYQYGYTVSIPLFEGDWKPDSFYERIRYNKAGGMHTLCLLDIKVCTQFALHQRSVWFTQLQLSGEGAGLQRHGGRRQDPIPAAQIHDGELCLHIF